MKKAAAVQEYERAADLRDLLSDLQRTTKKVNRFERIPYSLPIALDPARDLVELSEALGLPAPPERIEGFDISNISGTFKVASMVSFRNGRADRSNYRRFKIKTVVGQDDFSGRVSTVVLGFFAGIVLESEAVLDGSGNGSEIRQRLDFNSQRRSGSGKVTQLARIGGRDEDANHR